MQVKCVKLQNSDGSPIQGAHSLRLGDTYHVLQINVGDDQGGMFRLARPPRFGEDKVWPASRIALYPQSCFEILTGIYPSNWIMHVGSPRSKNFIEFGPASWSEGDFMEDFYNMEPYTLDIYKREFEIILKEDPVIEPAPWYYQDGQIIY